MTGEQRILVVDDEPLMRISLRDALSEEGYGVDETGSGSAGVRLLKDGSYDMVITDLKLPDADGLEVLKACRVHSPGTMVVLITAYGSSDTALEALRLGAYDYITKPFSMDEMLRMVRRVMTLKKAYEGMRVEGGQS